MSLIEKFVNFLGNWEVEVKAGKEEGSVEFDVAIDESSGGMIIYMISHFYRLKCINVYNRAPLLFNLHLFLGDCEVEEGEPGLANVKGEDITVCTDDFEAGDEFTLEVEFTSNPKPQKVSDEDFFDLKSLLDESCKMVI